MPIYHLLTIIDQRAVLFGRWIMRHIQLAGAGQAGSIFAPRPPAKQDDPEGGSNFGAILDEAINKPHTNQLQQAKSLFEGLR